MTLHIEVLLCETLFRPYWIQVEEKEWQGLWEKGVFKKWSRKRKDLLSNDRVFTSRYVYKLKRSAITGSKVNPGSPLGHWWFPDFWRASVGPRRKLGYGGSR
jgi:hypothetical protein